MTLRKTLLVCGILSSALYAAMTILIAQTWDGYSSSAHTISELSAVGAPTKPVWDLYGPIYTVLVTAFGFGVWKVASRNPALRVAGVMIIGFGSLGLLWPFAPMHSREVIAAGGGTWTDTMHLVLASVTVILMLLAIGFGAVAFGKAFRWYSIGSLLVLAVFGGLTFMDAPGLSTNSPTPLIGVWERINLGTFLLWLAVLATVLLRASRARPHQASRRSQAHGAAA
jgi:hypothetical protein